MEYAGFVFGIFGLMAYLQISSLKSRIAELERQMTAVKGSSYHEDRKGLIQTLKKCVGKKVSIELKEDHEDVDLMTYGNGKNGSVIIADIDDQWTLVVIENPKVRKEKLIRLESIDRISLLED